MYLYSAAASWRMGRLLGGDEGADLICKARRQFDKQGVANPEAFKDMLAPGFSRLC
jgi:hypothetical protein